MKKAVSLLLSLAMMVSLFAACGSDSTAESETTTTTTTTTDTSSSQMTSEGENVVDQADVVLDDSGEPEGIVAGTSATLASTSDFVSQLLPGMFNGAQYFYTLVYDPLFWSPSGDWTDLEGLLVKDYTISEDGLTWVMNLQEDVYFHNGNNLNAESVIGTFDFYLEYGHGTGIDSVELYEATGEHQVTLHLSYINPEMMYNLAITNLAIFDHTCYLEYGYTVEAAMGAGSGPYYIDSYAIGDYVILKAVEDYWMSDRQAHIETIDLKIITNTNTVFNALAAGEVDYSTITDYSYYELLVGSEDHTIVIIPGKASVVWMNTGGAGYTDLLANENVRKALTLLIDDEQVMLAASGGYGLMGGNPLNEAFNDYYYELREYDPDAGLALLEAEGIDPSDIALEAWATSATSAAYTNIQAQLMDYGISFEFVTTDGNVAMTEGMNGNWDLWVEGGGLGSLPYYCASQNNIWSATAVQVVVTDPDLQAEVADLTAQAASSLTVEDTYVYFAEACKVLDENYAYLCVWSGMTWGCFNNRIANFSVDLNTGNWRVFDSWIAE